MDELVRGLRDIAEGMNAANNQATLRKAADALESQARRIGDMREALAKCRGHAEFTSAADRELLARLLVSVARICDTALSAERATEEGR